MQPGAIEFVQSSSEADAARIVALLLAHNDQHTAPSRRVPYQIAARDERGAVHGGAIGWTIHRWCYVDILVLAPELRGTGDGTKLLAAVEALARARDCIGVHLTSYVFQAPDFYKRHGYTEFGRIDGMPQGHANVWLMKKF